MINRITKILSIPAITLLLFTACNEFIEPEKIYDENKTLNSGPQITSIVPADSAVAGVREIIINGSGFAVNGTDTNWVFVGGEPALIKSISENQIVFYRPAKAGNDLTISVVIPSAEGFGKKGQYKVSQAISSWGDFQFLYYSLTCVEADKNGNLYIGTRRKIYKLTSDGIILTNILGSDGDQYPSAWSNITDMKFGKDGYLYVCISKNDIYRVNPADGNEAVFASFSSRVEKMDFDQYGNVYAGRRDGIFVVHNGTVSGSGQLSGTEITELRIYDNNLYVATKKAIYRLSINENGNLGSSQLVTDISAMPEYSNCEISSLTIDGDGKLILCLKGHPKYSVFLLENNTTLSPYYFANIIPSGIDQLTFGSDRYLYLNRGITVPKDSTRLYKMGMEKAGAPYLGR